MPTHWKTPPTIKIYEALGCIADWRLEIDGSWGRVYSSSRGKFYTIRCDRATHAIMCNDNGSYYKDYLGYPAIAYLMHIWELGFVESYAQALKNIHWKDIIVAHDRNKWVGVPDYNFDAVIVEIDSLLQQRSVNIEEFRDFVARTMEQIRIAPWNVLGEKELPPKGY